MIAMAQRARDCHRVWIVWLGSVSAVPRDGDDLSSQMMMGPEKGHPLAELEYYRYKTTFFFLIIPSHRSFELDPHVVFPKIPIHQTCLCRLSSIH